ncbi:MAG: hypothetical protein ACJA2S_000927 [Cyclobacteriaceae bacterium]|jgi:hypothetical protein
MNRFIFLILCLVLGTVAQAQPKIGLSFAPSTVLNRVKYQSDNANVTNSGSAFGFKIGLELDFDIADNYAFNTGLTYAPKKTGYLIDPLDSPIQEEEYKLQYLQIPLTMKLYTSELIPDVRGFFQLGILAEIKIFSEPADDTYTMVESFKPFDTSLVLGFGAERNSGASSVLYAAIIYNRGLINTISNLGPNNASITEGLTSKLDMLSLQVGIKF